MSGFTTRRARASRSRGRRGKHVKTWPYGTQRRATVLEVKATALIVKDECREAHILWGTGHDKTLKEGDEGVITFTEGGPLGGYWKFERTATREQVVGAMANEMMQE